MTLLEQLEIEFQPLFDVRIRQVIADQKERYSKKYPFVSKIIPSMGTVCVIDRDGLLMHETNWKELENSDDDEFFDTVRKRRRAADDDEFIVFLQDVQTCKLCSFCPDEILFA